MTNLVLFMFQVSTFAAAGISFDSHSWWVHFVSLILLALSYYVAGGVAAKGSAGNKKRRK